MSKNNVKDRGGQVGGGGGEENRRSPINTLNQS